MLHNSAKKLRGLRGPLICVVIIAGAVFSYGLINYPDAPIRECAVPSGYCGKSSSPHTAGEYYGFIIWQTTLILIWPIAMLAAFLMYRRKN